jgi:hypothetical protein
MAQPAPVFFTPPPPPPDKSKFPGWAIAVIVAGSLVVLACFGGMTAFLVGGLGDDDRATATPARRSIAEAPAPLPERTASAVPFVPDGPPPADKTYQGRGNKTVDIDLDDDYTHIAKITHDGSSNFMVDSLTAGGSPVDLVVNEVGDYSGIRLLDAGREVPAKLKIRADGRWKVTVMVADKAAKWSGQASGKSDTILLVDPEDPEVRVRFTHKGKSNTTVVLYGEQPALLVNEIGRYSGEMSIPTGTEFIEITGDGTWTLTKV